MLACTQHFAPERARLLLAFFIHAGKHPGNGIRDLFTQLAISGKVIRAQSASGFSIIEVLVALLVLGVGVMGYAALQLKSVRLSEETYSRSQAMSVAQDFIERVRVNFNEASKARYVAAASWTGEVAESAPV